jgi:hypothetical protein
MTNPYRLGLEKLHKILRMTGDRVLLRAILQTDGSDLQVEGSDTRTAVCHQVEDVGPDVKDLAPGMHVLHISAAGDGLNPDQSNRSARYTIVREEDVIAYWWPEEALTEFSRLTELADQP